MAHLFGQLKAPVSPFAAAGRPAAAPGPSPALKPSPAAAAALMGALMLAVPLLALSIAGRGRGFVLRAGIACNIPQP